MSSGYRRGIKSNRTAIRRWRSRTGRTALAASVERLETVNIARRLHFGRYTTFFSGTARMMTVAWRS